MNINILDNDPIKAAWMACDKHAVKMPLETAQILCTVASLHGFSVPYRPTHKNHPCTIWAASSAGALEWLILHGLGLCETYSARYNKTHASQRVIEEVGKLPLLNLLPRTERPPFVLIMPDEYKLSDAVSSYRNYYRGSKRRFATWKAPVEPPTWF